MDHGDSTDQHFSIDQHFFELGSSIKGIPVIASGTRIGFGLVEVGCRPEGKRSQLKNKRQSFHEYWVEYWKERSQAVDWLPLVYRILAHYDTTKPMKSGGDDYAPDAILLYEGIHGDFFRQLTEQDMAQIYAAIGINRTRRARLDDIMDAQDPAELHKLIMNREETKTSNLRGIMAEILVQKDLERCMPSGMNLYRREDIAYLTEGGEKRKAEIDGILTLYGQVMYERLIESIAALGHIKVLSRMKVGSIGA